MKMSKLTANLMVEDVVETVKFYKDVFGFELVMVVEENRREVKTLLPEGRSLDYAMMTQGNVEIMFQARKSLTEDIPAFAKDQEIGGSLTFYIEVEDIGEWYNRLKNQVTLVKSLQTTFYGMQEFYVRDCNGYVLGFAQQG